MIYKFLIKDEMESGVKTKKTQDKKGGNRRDFYLQQPVIILENIEE